MSKNRVTTIELYREIGELKSEVHSIREDIKEIKALASRVQSLELFRSYTKGISACIAFLIPVIFGVSRFF